MEYLVLNRGQFVDPLGGQGHHFFKGLFGKRLSFSRSLDLNETALAGHDEITVHVGFGILQQ